MIEVHCGRYAPINDRHYMRTKLGDKVVRDHHRELSEGLPIRW